MNKPLRIADTTVHLIGHGYALKVTVKDAEGNVAFSGPVCCRRTATSARSGSSRLRRST